MNKNNLKRKEILTSMGDKALQDLLELPKSLQLSEERLREFERKDKEEEEKFLKRCAKYGFKAIRRNEIDPSWYEGLRITHPFDFAVYGERDAVIAEYDRVLGSSLVKEIKKHAETRTVTDFDTRIGILEELSDSLGIVNIGNLQTDKGISLGRGPRWLERPTWRDERAYGEEIIGKVETAYREGVFCGDPSQYTNYIRVLEQRCNITIGSRVVIGPKSVQIIYNLQKT